MSTTFLSRIPFVLCLVFLAPLADKMFTLMPSSVTGINFKNPLKETEQFNVLNYGYLYNGGGVAIGDINNDGLSDIYFTGNMVGSRLYINQGNFNFKEIAEQAGVLRQGIGILVQLWQMLMQMDLLIFMFVVLLQKIPTVEKTYFSSIMEI